MKTLMGAIMAVALLIGMSSCRTTKLVSDNTTTTRTEEVSYRPKTIRFHVPADSVSLDTNIASGIHFVHLNDTVTVPCFEISNQGHTVTDGDITIEVYLDSMANLRAKAVTREKELEKTILEKERVIKELTTEVKVYKEMESAFSRTLKRIAIYLLLTLVIAGIIVGVVKKYFML